MSHYFRPGSQAEALSLLNEDTCIVAGATDVYPARTSQRAWGQVPAENWLDITGLPGLNQIQAPGEHSGEGWRIGALVTWSDLQRAGMPDCFNGLVAAAREVGGMQIQNRATLVGNICNASPAADGVPPLMCLDASVEISSAGGVRNTPLREFIQGNRQVALQPDEMVTAVCIPGLPDSAKGYFYKLGARKYLVISIVMVAGLVSVNSDGLIEDIRIAVGSCSAVAQRLTSLEAALRGCTLGDSLTDKIQQQHFAALTPIDDVRSDAAYRHRAAAELVSQLLQDMQASAEPPP